MIDTIKTIWNALEIRNGLNSLMKESEAEMKERWPIMLGLAVLALLPFTVSLISSHFVTLHLHLI